MKKKAVSTTDAPAAIGPYSQAIECDGWVFCSGQIPIDPVTGQMVSSDIGSATTRVLENLKAVLEAAGLDLACVVKTTVYLADMGQFGGMNEVYGKYFSESKPARATVAVAALPKGALVEIEAVARRNSQ